MKTTTLLICGLSLILIIGLIKNFKSDSTPVAASVSSNEPSFPRPVATSTPSAQNIEPAVTLMTPPISAAKNDQTSKLLKAIYDALASEDSTRWNLAYTNLLPALVKINPPAAAQLVASLAVGPQRTDAMRSVAQAWASLHPIDAENWAVGLPDATERNFALTAIASEIAATDPAQAVSVAEQFGLGEHTEVMLQNFTQQWARRDLAAAKAWAMAKPAGESRDNLLARIAFCQSTTDPAGAAVLVVEQIPAGPVQTEAAMSVIHQWGVSDLSGATAWVDLFPPGPLKERAQQELAGIAAWQFSTNE